MSDESILLPGFECEYLNLKPKQTSRHFEVRQLREGSFDHLGTLYFLKRAFIIHQHPQVPRKAHMSS